MTSFVTGRINDRWELELPDFRVEFHAVRPLWEAGRLADCDLRMQPNMRVFDVGAEHGDFTALYRSWVGPSVIPVEAAPRYWPCIRATYEANGFGHPPAAFCGFASSRTTSLEVVTSGWPPEVEGEVVADPGFKHLAQDAAPEITLDHLASFTGSPDAVVIDVEGAEYRVLEGSRRILQERHVVVWVSVHEPTMLAWYGRTLDDLHRLMGEFGYEGELLPHFGEGETFWRYERR